MLSHIKLLLSIHDTEQDTLLNALIEDTTAYVLSYTKQPVLLESMHYVVIQLVLVRYNTLGNEGDTSRSEGNIVRQIEHIPKHLKHLLNRYRKVGW